MTRRKLLLLGLGAIVCLGVGFAIYGLLPPRPVSGRTAVSVRLKWLHQAQFAGFYVAKEKGFYESEGLDVTLNAGGVDFPAVQMVAGGGEDFGVTAADQILLARDKGVPVVALAVIYRKSPMVYFSLKDSGITKLQDFVGKRAGVKLGGNEELTYRAMIRKAGIDPKSVNEVVIKYDISPLLQGKVDVWPGYAINEPIVAEERGFPVNLIWPSDYGVSLYADTVFATEKTIAERPEIVQKFVRATVRGWQYAIEHPDEAVQCTLTYGEKLDAGHETRMMEASIPLVKPDDAPVGSMDKDTWAGMAQLLLEQNFMKKPINVDEAFTQRFISGPQATATTK